MKSKLMYVEAKSGFSDNGPAWIGKAFFSRSGQTIYFNGQAFKKGSGISGNYFEIETGDEYWISGVKKDGKDRHWAGGGKIVIDKSVISEYLEIVDLADLPKNKFEIDELNNTPPIQSNNELENQIIEKEEIDDDVRFKNVKDLSDKELLYLKNYYEELDPTETHKKARRYIKDKISMVDLEIGKRKLSMPS